MANWIQRPADKLIYQQDQMQFLADRRRRICKTCRTEYNCPPNHTCPTCSTKGIRVFDRLTIIAGRRFGKSLFGSIAGTEEASISNTIGWACAPTNPKLHRYVIPAFQKLIPPDWVADWSSEFLDLRLTNDSLIHFQTLEHPDQGRGQGLDWLWIDEVCELTEDHWNVISPSLADKQGVAFFTTSPRSYDWVYEQLYKPAEDLVPGYWGLHARTFDNPIFHTKEGVEFLEREKDRMPDTMYRQEYEADFVIFTGAVYGGAIDAQILHNDTQIQAIIPEWPDVAPWRQVLVGIDSGADHPFGAVKLVSTEQGLVVIGEYMERDKTFIQHAEAMKRLANSPTTRWAINKNERQPTIELAQHGIYPQGAENDIVAGTERVKSWLHQKQLWFVEDRCPLLVKQMKAYRWAESKTKDGQLRDKEKVFKKNDELPDCFVAGTLVRTQAGDIPIEMVQTGDLVYTRMGLQPVTCAGSRYANTHTLLLSDGTALTGTASHPVWTEGKGFVPLTSLRYGDMIWSCTQTTIGPEPAVFGPNTMDRFRQTIKSTTSTGINRITISKTLNVSLSGRTSNTTKESNLSIHTSASNAGNCSEVRKNPTYVSAPIVVNPHGAELQVLTTRPGHVSAAVLHSFVTGSQDSGIALNPVESVITYAQWSNEFAKDAAIYSKHNRQKPVGAVIVVGGEPTGRKERVYNLSVDSCPEYFANGILVHNCLRYALMTWPQLPKVAPPADNVRDISKLPEDMQRIIIRERNINKGSEPLAPNDVVGDFYL